MHHIHRMLFIVLACLAASATAAEVDSRIDGVIIYPGNIAEIERVASVDLQSGQDELVFTDLPAAIVDGSVRIAVTEGAATIGGIEMSREPVGEPPRERERKLREQIEQLEHQHQDAMDRVAAANNEITFIEGLAELPKGEKAAAALTDDDGVENWQSLWERIGTGSREARRRMRTGEREAADLQKEIETLKQKLNQLGRSIQQAVTVTVPYRSSVSGSAELKLILPRARTGMDTALRGPAGYRQRQCHAEPQRACQPGHR
ncbi:MAG: DUF4140 domain-containing protein [Gammaproteobacteria bacterium]|nr:DUF4140 domain-containing protein [Gammaproteobacteria bacterium]